MGLLFKVPFTWSCREFMNQNFACDMHTTWSKSFPRLLMICWFLNIRMFLTLVFKIGKFRRSIPNEKWKMIPYFWRSAKEITVICPNPVVSAYDHQLNPVKRLQSLLCETWWPTPTFPVTFVFGNGRTFWISNGSSRLQSDLPLHLIASPKWILAWTTKEH